MLEITLTAHSFLRQQETLPNLQKKFIPVSQLSINVCHPS
jgi:hypothetical protein